MIFKGRGQYDGGSGLAGMALEGAMGNRHSVGHCRAIMVPQPGTQPNMLPDHFAILEGESVEDS